MLTVASLSLASSSSLWVYNWPVRLLDKDLLALPTESGIDILSLPDLSLVDHIDVIWDKVVMTMNDGKIAYVEKGGGGEALRVYDLETKEDIEIKKGEIKRYDHPVISGDWIGYREKDRDRGQDRLCLSRVNDGRELEVKKGETWFSDAYENYFVIWNWGGPIEVYDVLEQQVIVSKEPRKGWCDGASIDGEWIVYVDRAPNDMIAHDIWLWNYRTGEERLVSKGVDGEKVERQNDCIISGDTIIWVKDNDASGKFDPALYVYNMERNKTELLWKENPSKMLVPVDLNRNYLLLWDRGNKTYLIHDLSTGKEVELRR